MNKFDLQHDLFNNYDLDFTENNLSQEISIEENIIKEWQDKIIKHQTPIFKSRSNKLIIK